MKLFVMNMRKSIREQYLKLLDREPTLDDLDFYADKIQKNKINLEQLSIILKDSNVQGILVNIFKNIQVLY